MRKCVGGCRMCASRVGGWTCGDLVRGEAG